MDQDQMNQDNIIEMDATSLIDQLRSLSINSSYDNLLSKLKEIEDLHLDEPNIHLIDLIYTLAKSIYKPSSVYDYNIMEIDLYNALLVINCRNIHSTFLMYQKRYLILLKKYTYSHLKVIHTSQGGYLSKFEVVNLFDENGEFNNQ